MGDPIIKNPELFRRIPVEGLNREQQTRAREGESRGPDPAVRVADTNHNGAADHGDRFTNVLTGKKLSGSEARSFLNSVCIGRATHKTSFTETPLAREIRHKNGASIFDRQRSSTGKSETLFGADGSASSAGAYDPSLRGCNYNRDAVHLEAGRTSSELKATFTDATGTHSQHVDLAPDRKDRTLP